MLLLLVEMSGELRLPTRSVIELNQEMRSLGLASRVDDRRGYGE